MEIKGGNLCRVYFDDIKHGTCKIPKGITRIGDRAFDWLYSSPGRGAGSIFVPGSNYSLKKIRIPKWVVSIGKQAFWGCMHLKQVLLTSGLINIEEEAFAVCASLRGINIPSSVKHIGDRAFRECTSLMHINIPDGVEYIGDKAFWNCESLESIKLPNGIEYIGAGIFDWCISLKEITYKGRMIKASCIDGWCMELVHSRKYDKYTIHKGYHFPDYETVYYVAECDGKYAHGKTAKEAIRDLEFKLCKDRGIEQYKGLTLNDKVNGYEFYRIMTGACHAGVKSYCDRTGTDINGEYTIQEVINKTKGEYGHDTLLSNLRKLGILEV